MILCLSLTHCSGISTDSGTESITGLHRADSLLYVYGKTESAEFPTTKNVVKPGETLDYSQGFYSVFTTSGELVSSSEIGGFGTEVIVDITTDKTITFI